MTRAKVSLIIWVFVFFYFSVSSQAATKPEIYAVMTASQLDEYLNPILELEFIAGIAFYIGHKRIEPKQGQIEGNFINSLLQKCHSKKKKVKVGLLFGQWTPEWVYKKGVPKLCCNHKFRNFFPGVRKICFPQPWNRHYLKILRGTIDNLGRLFGKNPLLQSIQITGPSPVNGLETNFDVCSIPINPKEAKAKIIQAWQYTIEKYAENFSQKDLTIALHDQFFGRRDYKPASQIKDNLLQTVGDKGRIMVCYLTDKRWFKTSNRSVKIWLDRRIKHRDAQMIDIFSRRNVSPFAFKLALLKAEKMGVSRIEIFAEDCLNAEYQQVIKKLKYREDKH